MNKYCLLIGICLAIVFKTYTQSVDSITIHIGTYLGNEERNFYGNKAPAKLDSLWSIYLGEGISPAYGNPNKTWKGAGWTGQPLVVEEKGEIFLIQGAFDYHLKKIKAEKGELVWEYSFDDILKGTGTIWENSEAESPDEKYIVLQGSRRGVKNSINSKYCPSLRGVSYNTGEEFWRLNVKRTLSYSRDVDGSALVINDTAYLALENGLFTVFSPDPKRQQLKDGMLQPQIYKEIPFFLPDDTLLHGKNIESESSPCYLNGRIYTTSGSGRVYGYNINIGAVDWIFEIGADLNGSAVVTSDNCLLIAVEKQYIEGRGGVFKLDPSKDPGNCVIWYYPVEDKKWFHWEGGIVGSVAINDSYCSDTSSNLAAFIGVDGYLNVVDHKSIDTGKVVLGPNNKIEYKTPELVFRKETGGTISTPIFTDNKLIAPLDSGLLLYEYSSDYDFRLLDKIDNIQIDATPVVWNGRLYVASMDGYLYCFGKK